MKSWEEYIKSAPDIKYAHYWDLGPSVCLGLNRIPRGLKLRAKTISVKKLSTFGKNSDIEKLINFIALWRGRGKTFKLKIKLPLNLVNLDYVQLYSLMLSEGSFRNEFRLHVPEEIFHKILTNSLTNLLGKQVLNFRYTKKFKNINRTTFPAIIRYLFPIPEHIPKFILENKKFLRVYLRIAFEAEGSPIFVESKRYIRLVRSIDISPILKNFDMPIEAKMPFGEFKNKHPRLANIILDNPPKTLLGEHLILLNNFNIFNTIKPELIRRNKTSFRRGEFSAKWALHIYSEDLEKFAREIGFLTKNKRSKMLRMLKVKGRRRKLSAFNEVIKNLQKDGIFHTKDFSREMKKRGYKSNSRAFLWRYKKYGLIKTIKHGIYEIKHHP